MIELASQTQPLEISARSCAELVDRLDSRDAGLAGAIRAVGVGGTIRLLLGEKLHLLNTLEAWGNELGGFGQLPEGLYALQRALSVDLSYSGQALV